MAETTFHPKSWAPGILGVVSILLAFPGSLFQACLLTMDKVEVSYAGLTVSQTKHDGAVVLEAQVDGRRVTRPVSPEALQHFLMLGKLQIWAVSVFSLFLLVCGIGQVLYRGWGRRLSIGWASCSLVFLLLEAVVIFPEYSSAAVGLCERLVGGRRALASCPSAPFGDVLLFASLLTVYPLITLTFFSSRSARQAMGS